MVGPVQAARAAREAVSDTMAICERKPDVCKTAKAALHTIVTRAKETARFALEYVNTETDKTATGSITNEDGKDILQPPEPVAGKNVSRP